MKIKPKAIVFISASIRKIVVNTIFAICRAFYSVVLGSFSGESNVSSIDESTIRIKMKVSNLR